MNFDLNRSIEILERTPSVLDQLLQGLSSDWTATASDEKNWQPYDVVGHLIHGELTDWIPRAEIILAQGADRTFTPFDRFAQFEASAGKDLDSLLAEFGSLRAEGIKTLRSWNLSNSQLQLSGTHPELGEVSLKELLATWVVHDLNHIRQIVGTLAKRYEREVGPWRAYLGILN
jgi:hypothetical protein